MKNESVKKSLEKSKNVLEEKRKIVNRKICIKKTHVYNNCYELRSSAIKKDFSNTSLRVVKKDSAPIQFKFFELLKNKEKANNSTSYRCAAINN